VSGGLAFERVRAALAAHGRAMRQVGGRLAASCPGPGHWRGDHVPSLVVTAGPGLALVYCHAGCHTEDVLGALGLTAADLYDEPARKRPRYNALRRAIGAAAGFTAAEKYPLMWLLCKTRGDAVLIPAEYQPESLAALADEMRPLDPRNLRAAFGHWQYHGWLSMPCALPGCFREGTHPGRGHRPSYFLDLGEDCPGESCPTRKRGPGTLFRKGGQSVVKRGPERREPAGSGPEIPEVRSRRRAAPVENRGPVCETCGGPVSPLRRAQAMRQGGAVICVRCEAAASPEVPGLPRSEGHAGQPEGRRE
jgi:hypothetical protein